MLALEVLSGLIHHEMELRSIEECESLREEISGHLKPTWRAPRQQPAAPLEAEREARS